MKTSVIEIMRNAAGFPYLRLKSRNGRIIFVTEAYQSMSNARRAANTIIDMRHQAVSVRDCTKA